MHPDIAAPSLNLAKRVRGGLEGAGVSAANYVGTRGLDGRGDLGGVNLSDVPKVFVELGNMRSEADASGLESGQYRARLAGGVAQGIRQYLER